MKVLIAGDFCPQNRVAALFDEGEFGSVLQNIRDVVSTADYSIVNFECPVVTREAKPIIKIGPNLKCSESGIKAIKWAGFNCVTLANNHFYDFGEEGVKCTLETCTKLGIDTVGGGNNLAEASKILYKQINSKIIAIVNCCEHEFSIATDKTGGSNPLNPIQQYYAIKEAKTKADYVFVIVHGGHEHWQLPSLRMVETYRFFIDVGADAVVNHHQHCISGYEVYKGKPIFYGLGNFCFDDSQYHNGIWTEGYAVIINFEFEEPTFQLFPYQQCTEEPSVKLLPQDAFCEKLKELNSIIVNDHFLKTKVDKYYASCAMQYSDIFEPIRNRFYLGAKRRGWLPSFISKKRKIAAADYIICEAHRDKMTYWLERIN